MLLEFPVRERRLRIPLGLKLKVKASDSAIYIGNFRIVRDEFDEVTKIDIVDDYTKVSREVSKRLGKGMKLRKSIGVPL